MKDRPEELRYEPKYSDWRLSPHCARIVALENYQKEITWMKMDFLPEYDPSEIKVACTSGGYDPIHPGHISCLLESNPYSKKLNGDHDFLVVIVNGDNFLKTKKGKPFMDLKTRCQIVSSISFVDVVIPFEIENDMTVCEALKVIKPDYFTKGGDRKDPTSIPEWSICQELGIEVVFNIGEPKFWSSSDFLKDWTNYASSK